jgi:hypothetical protein
LKAEPRSGSSATSSAGIGSAVPPDLASAKGAALAANDYQINLSAEFHTWLADCAHNSAVHIRTCDLGGPPKSSVVDRPKVMFHA